MYVICADIYLHSEAAIAAWSNTRIAAAFFAYPLFPNGPNLAPNVLTDAWLLGFNSWRAALLSIDAVCSHICSLVFPN
jgi:hypothetical protein